ncbi:MAG: agmatine deiminase family protein [Bryobacteraceae bacterium]
MPSLRMPAEWHPHEATWIAWPHETSDWPGKFQPVPWVYGEFVRKVSRVERVRILADGERHEGIRRVLQKSGAVMEAVELFPYPTDRSWTRDFCPTFVHDDAGAVTALNWRFNAWAKYDNWQRDDAAPDFIARKLRLPQQKPALGKHRIVLEGGSIEVNGAGTLLTTEECLLSDVQARNPGLGRGEIEAVFAQYLGIRKVLWLNNGIAGDDTHGHIDDLARFTDRHTVVIATESDKTDPNYEPLRENLRLLRAMTDQDGQPLRVVTLPMPRPVVFHGQRLPASYANFYIANGLVLVPTFNDPADRVALGTLAKLFPQREVCGIHCVDLVLGLGTLHCMTQQQPAALTL